MKRSAIKEADILHRQDTLNNSHYLKISPSSDSNVSKLYRPANYKVSKRRSFIRNRKTLLKKVGKQKNEILVVDAEIIIRTKKLLKRIYYKLKTATQ